jgi:hypothetical protein
MAQLELPGLQLDSTARMLGLKQVGQSDTMDALCLVSTSLGTRERRIT